MGKLIHSNLGEIRPVKSAKEREEFGGGKKGVVICPNCKAAYYKKSWHHDMAHLEGKEDMPVTFMLCPADQMIKNGQYEGKVVIKNAPKELEAEIANLIKNIGFSAFEKEPMHRLISIEKVKGELVALTTENQLAVSMAKKIGSAHKAAKVKISFAKEPNDVAIAVVQF
ncbi:MAG: hypothetical protein ACYC3G_03260 [Minisyncoccota bacterium]